jgi:aryl-alcohol dehydrogenase-like predicted oxidoreductase
MRYTQLGRTGLQVSVVGLGCNNFGTRAMYGGLDADASAAVVSAAVDAGITFFDTADVYGDGDSERFVGEVVKGVRDDVVLATKFGSKFGGSPNYGVPYGSRRYLRRAVEGSLRRLQTDRIDLYQLQWFDPLTPLEETLFALNELVEEGKVLYFGTSHFFGWQIVDLHWMAEKHHLRGFVSAQNHYNLLDREAEQELVPACEHVGVGLLPYFPLANGLLTGKYSHGAVPAASRLAERTITDGDLAAVGLLQGFADEVGHSITEVAIAGLAGRPAVASVIAGATTVAQVQANAAAGNWVLEQSERAALDQQLVKVDEARRAGGG